MMQCFTCHGRTPGAKAPGNCELCHPASFTMRPASHKPTKTWLSTHGRAAEQESAGEDKPARRGMSAAARRRIALAQKRRWAEFLSDLKSNQPVLILVRAKTTGPRFDVLPEEVASKCPECSPEILAGFTSLADYVRENYVRELLFDGAYAAFHRKTQ